MRGTTFKGEGSLRTGYQACNKRIMDFATPFTAAHQPETPSKIRKAEQSQKTLLAHARPASRYEHGTRRDGNLQGSTTGRIPWQIT